MNQIPKDSQNNKTNEESDHVPKFIKTLYKILDDKACSEYISWSQDGRAVVIKKPVEFAETLLPVYFKHSNLSSFVRQLNLYEFRKKKRYPYDSTFAHTMFIKGRVDLLKFIRRKNSNNVQGDKPSPKPESSSTNENEIEELMGQNMWYKKVHKEMNEKIESLENAVKSLASAGESLQQQYLKKKHNEDILKQVIVKAAKMYGSASITEIFESVALSEDEKKQSLRYQTRSSSNTRKSEANQGQNLILRNISSNKTARFDHSEIDELAMRKNVSLPTNYRTFSAASTIGELNQPVDLYQNNYDDFGSQELSNEISYPQMYNLKVLNIGSEDYYNSDMKRDTFNDASRNFSSLEMKAFELNPSSSAENEFLSH